MSSFLHKAGGGEEEDIKVCRICFEPETCEERVISPCNCSGSQKYVHHECLSKWQATVLFQETSAAPNETRHLRCSTCDGEFHGMSIPTRKKLLSSVCGVDVASSLQVGSFLVASRSNSERPVSTNFPALVGALFRVKRAHWKYGVYFIFHYGQPDFDDLEGESKVFALNLTRLMDGSSEFPIPDEVLNQQHILKESRNAKQDIAAINVGKESADDVSFPYIIVKHHNGGPVKWSSHRSGMFVVEQEIGYLEEQLALRGFVSSVEAVEDRNDPAALFLSSFMIIPLSRSSCLVLGKFSVVMDIVQSILHLFQDGSEILLFSYSGYAEWTKAQLLREVARGSWGVVKPDTALVACEALLNPMKKNDMSEFPTLEELSSTPKVASLTYRDSCNAQDISSDQMIQQNESSKMYGDLDHNLSSGISKGFDDDVVPPIPNSVRIPSQGITRARSASNTAASASVKNCGTLNDSDSKVSMCSNVFNGLNEGNIWDEMITISVESGDNIIRQSYVS